MTDPDAIRAAHVGHDIRLYGLASEAASISVTSNAPGDFQYDGSRALNDLEVDHDDFYPHDAECRTCERDLDPEEVAALWDGETEYDVVAGRIQGIVRFTRDRALRRQRLATLLQGLSQLPPDDFDWLRDLVNGLELVALLDSKP